MLKKKEIVQGKFESTSLLFFIASIFGGFILGIAVHSISDMWIDQNPVHHLGLKYLWVNEDMAVNTDQKLKLAAFEDVFGTETGIDKPSQEQIYHAHKHKILKSDIAYYVLESQILVEYS